jgi:hypothetical protein
LGAKVLFSKQLTKQWLACLNKRKGFALSLYSKIFRRLKTYFGIFETKGTTPVESTVLVFDQKLSIGYRSAEGLNQMLQWQLKDLQPTVDFSRQATVITHLQQPGLPHLSWHYKARTPFPGTAKRTPANGPGTACSLPV